MNIKWNRIIKKCALAVLVLSTIVLTAFYYAMNGQKVCCVTECDNREYYYRLEFERMNKEDSYIFPACEYDVFAVRFKIDKGRVDLIIGIDGMKPIYKGNDIEAGTFDVIVPKDGEYSITISAKYATGFVEVYERKGTAENYDN